jgi:outer membrane protein OmpA-like peptidoglycan-associated protein
MLFADEDNDSMFSLSPISNREFVFSNVYFDVGSAAPNKALFPHLDEIAVFMRRNPNRQLRVEGHTDARGTKQTNLNLSKKRAEWIVNYLTKKGVNPAKMSIDWYGESRPLVSNATQNGRAKNRRVEMLLTSPYEALPSLTETR